MNKNKYLLFLSVIILCISGLIVWFMNQAKDETEHLQYYTIDIPELELSNADSDLGKWMLPVLLLDGELVEDFIEKNVFISSLRVMALEGSSKVTFLSFTVTYFQDNSRIVKSYRIEDDGNVAVILEPSPLNNNEPLLLIRDFIKMFELVDKNEIKELAKSNVDINWAEFNELERLSQAEIEDDEIVIYNNRLVPFSEIDKDGLYIACYTVFHLNGTGFQIPFIHPI